MQFITYQIAMKTMMAGGRIPIYISAKLAICQTASIITIRHNALKITMLMLLACIEMMMNSANIAFITFADAWGGADGRIFVFFVVIVAAAEAAIGLGIVIALYRLHGSIDLDRADLMRG